MTSKTFGLVPAVLFAALAAPAVAVDQTVPGPGNHAAERIAAASDRVQEAHRLLRREARTIRDTTLRSATTELLDNRNFCITSRRGVDDAVKARMLTELAAAGLLNPADDATFPGGLKAGIFPPVLDETSACPHLPMAFDAAPGSSFGGHHGYPGGLPIHEANNERADISLAADYRASYGDASGRDRAAHDGDDDEVEGWRSSPFFIDQDVIIAAPIWHDWAKTVVFQWAADGSEFKELNFGGNPANGSATGGHHIIGIGESIKRGLPAAFVIAQASAHSAPTLGNEFKVVNWIRAASILAQVDPVAAGYLARRPDGSLRLPALRRLGNGVDLPAIGQTNVLVEYTLHNLSDGDFTYSITAAAHANALIAQLAARYGFDPADVKRYNTEYRNPVFANLSQERIAVLYANGGIDAVAEALDTLRSRRVF